MFEVGVVCLDKQKIKMELSTITESIDEINKEICIVSNFMSDDIKLLTDCQKYDIYNVVKIVCNITYCATLIILVTKLISSLIDVLFPKVNFSIKYMMKHIGNLPPEQLLLPEGKSHLNL